MLVTNTWQREGKHYMLEYFSSRQRQRWFGVCRECWLPDLLWPTLGVSPHSGEMATMITTANSWFSPRSATFRLPPAYSTMSRFLGVMWPRTTHCQVVFVWPKLLQPSCLHFDSMVSPGFLEMTMTSLSPETRGCRFFYPSTHLKKCLLFNPPISEIQTKRFREKVVYSV